MIKRYILAFAAFTALLAGSAGAHSAEISAECAVVYEPVTGQVLFKKNSDERRLIASTTKIMTALVVLESCDLRETVEIKPEHAAVEGSSMYLEPGVTYTVEELLYGLLLASGNDAAAALADHVSGSMSGFAGLMNEKCRELGLENTHFVNAHGLDDEQHYSTAHELALITAAALENEDFREIFSARSHRINGIDYYNHNRLLTSCEGCIGGKTGYTRAAGRTLVSCAERDGMTLICVTISAPDDWNDHELLYDQIFAEYSYIPVSGEGLVPVLSGTLGYAHVQPETKAVVVPEGSEIIQRVFLPRFAFAPVMRGSMAGRVSVVINGSEQEIPLRYSESVFLDGTVPLTLWERLQRAWYLACRYGVYYPA